MNREQCGGCRGRRPVGFCRGVEDGALLCVDLVMRGAVSHDLRLRDLTGGSSSQVALEVERAHLA